MNTKQLEYFISVAETLSFTKTAEKFYISQTAITQQIKSLEESMGVTLFKRDKRHVKLTPAGEFFLMESKSIIENINSAIQRTQEIANGFVGTLNIGIMPGYKKSEVSKYLKEFSAICPNVTVELCSNDMGFLLNSLKNNTMDIAFVINPEHYPLSEFEYKHLNNCSLVALLPKGHKFFNEESIDLASLKDEKFIFVKESSDDYKQKTMVQERYKEAGFVPNIVQRTNDFDTIQFMVASGIGISILPSFCISSSMLSEEVVTVPIKDRINRIEVVVAWNKKNSNPALPKFISLL